MIEKPSRISRKRERTRREIVDAAREVVSELGLPGFTLDEVAQRLGLTKAALYYYFRSKEALAFELLIEEYRNAANEVHQAVGATTSGADALEALVRAYVQHYRSRPEMFQLTHTEIPRSDPQRLIGATELQQIRALNDLLFGAVAEKIRADQAEARAGAHENPRRLAFVAYVAAIGMLTITTLVEAVGDPLLYGDEELIAEMCALLRGAVTPQKGSS